MTLRLDLGSGPRPPDGWVGVDLCEPAEGADVRRFDLASAEPWPFLDDTVDELRASHLIEHLPNANVFPGYDMLLWFFDQAWRVARVGATFTLAWPNPMSPVAYRDPTHRRFLALGVLDYLSEQGRETLGVSQYQVRCDWRVQSAETRFSDARMRNAFAAGAVVPPDELFAVLVKPPRGEP